MKTTRKIVNDCFFKGRPLDYKQHKAIIEELNAMTARLKEALPKQVTKLILACFLALC